MAAFKIRLRRLLRSPLSSCNSKDKSNDVVNPHPSPIFTPNKYTDSLTPELNGRKCPPATPISYPSPKEKKKCRKTKRRISAYKNYNGFEDMFPDCNYNGLFSSDEDDEEEVESRRRSFSAAVRRRRTAVEDSLAVVKRSSDPYTDFRTSMVEMIVENQIFAAKDLEKLLQCFLNLNSQHHHQIIVQVFAEIWEALHL